ncbi:MAG TPA: protein-L-isoaspartate O-methyltransferase [Rhodopila sp.]|uniref:protein-L-isoaspartate O-methyltransferase family protein n=1 Tax=Rhodopila sp. TaxID=2480087 RepID=UPI002BF489CA|nr:protein-L-isoaspartate O-methyltransferase [Rhodopila sp.]HVY16811.1 protein-L-isoaspartate O-methyltransferase [Rhodopila sp.]
MATQAEVFADARKKMVDSQIRPNRVTDPRILSAMRRLPRERFLPPSVLAMAYVDDDVPLGNGRYLMEPMVLARMLQAAQPRENERTLVVGSGTGYGAAVLAACGCRVVALEDDPALLGIANAVLPTEAPSVTVVSGPLAAGWAANAPYDLILIEGAVPEIPAAVQQQLHREEGRLVTALFDTLRDQAGTTRAILAEATVAGLSITPIFDCATPPLPALRRTPAFEF